MGGQGALAIRTPKLGAGGRSHCAEAEPRTSKNVNRHLEPDTDFALGYGEIGCTRIPELKTRSKYATNFARHCFQAVKTVFFIFVVCRGQARTLAETQP